MVSPKKQRFGKNKVVKELVKRSKQKSWTYPLLKIKGTEIITENSEI